MNMHDASLSERAYLKVIRSKPLFLRLVKRIAALYVSSAEIEQSCGFWSA
jgi:hypothetical protein